MPLLKLYWMFY